MPNYKNSTELNIAGYFANALLPPTPIIPNPDLTRCEHRFRTQFTVIPTNNLYKWRTMFRTLCI